MSDRPLDREMLANAFERLGAILARKGIAGEIAVYGGTAVMLQIEYRENTADVDCLVTIGHGPVMEAAREVGRQLGIGQSWLNENVSVYTSRNEKAADLIPYGRYPASGRAHLNVMLAKPEYLVAMKVEALVRGANRDATDLGKLAVKLGLRTSEDVFRMHAAYFGPENLTVAVKQSVRSIIDGLQREGES